MTTMIMIYTLCCLAAVQNGTTELMDIGRGAMPVSKLKFPQGFQALAYRKIHKCLKKKTTDSNHGTEHHSTVQALSSVYSVIKSQK